MKNMKLIMENFNKFLTEEEGETNSPQAGKLDFNPEMKMVYTTEKGDTLRVDVDADGVVVFRNINIMAGQKAVNALKSKENMYLFLTKIEDALSGKIVDAEFKDLLQKMLQKILGDDRKAFLSALQELLNSGLLVTAELLMDLKKTNPEKLGKTLYRMVPKGEGAPSYDFVTQVGSLGSFDTDLSGAAMLEAVLEKLPQDERNKISAIDGLESEFEGALADYAEQFS